MRIHTWAATALAMFGCAQSPSAPVVSAAFSPAPPDAGPQAVAEAGVPAGPCNPSIDASAGTSISDTGACPGILPAPVSCAADIVLCTGVTTGGNGLSGTFAATATSDGRGSLARAA